MKYIQVTHTYVVPWHDEDGDEDIDPVVNAGVTMMEKTIRKNAQAVLDLKSSWLIMPQEYNPEDELKITPAVQITRQELMRIASRDPRMEPGQVSFTGDIMGQRPQAPGHPWDQGLRVLPIDHELAPLETEALASEGMLCPITHDIFHNYRCIGVKGHAPGEHIWRNKDRPEIPEVTDEGH